MAYHKIIRFYFILGTFFFLAISCSKEVKDYSWISGTWKRDFNETSQIEEWQLMNDTLVGSAYHVAFGDTTLYSTSSMFTNDQGKLELVQLKNGSPSTEAFQFEGSTDSSFTFNRNSNVFPQQFSYTIRKDSLLIFNGIAETNGFTNKIEYEFKRMK